MFAEDAPGRDDAQTREALRRLEERLDRASEAAEALMAEAAGAAARGAANVAGAAARAVGAAGTGPGSAGTGPGSAGTGPGSAGTGPGSPPPAGWQLPREEAEPSPSLDLEALIRGVAALRELIPADLQHRIAEAVRELLLALRALIDWYLERVERRPPVSSEAQDIPIL